MPHPSTRGASESGFVEEGLVCWVGEGSCALPVGCYDVGWWNASAKSWRGPERSLWFVKCDAVACRGPSRIDEEGAGGIIGGACNRGCESCPFNQVLGGLGDSKEEVCWGKIVGCSGRGELGDVCGEEALYCFPPGSPLSVWGCKEDP